MAMWSMLGARDVTMVAWGKFGDGWINDAVKQLKLDKIFNADYGDIVDMESLNYDTTLYLPGMAPLRSVCLKDGNAIPHDELGLTIVMQPQPHLLWIYLGQN